MREQPTRRQPGLSALSKRHSGDCSEPRRVTPLTAEEEAKSRRQKRKDTGGKQRRQDQLRHTDSPDRGLQTRSRFPVAPRPGREALPSLEAGIALLHP